MIALSEYRKKLWNSPQLRFMFFEITDQCNLNCKHCGSGCSSGNCTFLEYSVVVETMKKIAGKYKPEEIMICISGGEPMLHADIVDIVRAAHDMGFPVGMTSNGSLIDEISARNLADAGLGTIAISIDGLNNTHDQFRGSAGSFKRTIAGVKNLREAGIEPQAITVIHKGNIRELPDMYEFFRNEGFYSWRVVNMEPIGRANNHKELLLSIDELTYLLSFIKEKRFDSSNQMEVTYGCSHFLGYDFERETRDFYFQCGAGTMVASIMANGDIGTCLDIERNDKSVQGNIYKDNFIEVWENRFHFYRMDRTEKNRLCGNCQFRRICMGDSAHTWDYSKDEPGYCLINMIKENQI